MKKINLIAVAAFAVVAAGFTSCDKKDDCPDCKPGPKPVEQPSTLTGKVVDINGNPIAGATVVMGSAENTAVTDADGVYVFTGFENGAFAMEADANGYQAAFGDVTTSATDGVYTYVWNAILYKDAGTNFTVTTAGGGEGEAESQAIKDNDEGEITMTATIPQGSVSKDVNITITPIYNERLTRAEEMLLIGADVECSDPTVTLSTPMDVNFDLDNTAIQEIKVKKLVNNAWVEVPASEYTKDAEGITVKTLTFGKIGLFFNVTMTQTNGYDALAMTPNKWDNLSGVTTITATTSTFTYKLGGELNVGAQSTNNMRGLLLERLAQIIGSRTAASEAGSYALDTRINPGYALQISGTQDKTTVRLQANGYQVSGTKYGDVKVKVTTYGADHNGGVN